MYRLGLVFHAVPSTFWLGSSWSPAFAAYAAGPAAGTDSELDAVGNTAALPGGRV
jgi:hypothetical protein